MNEIVFCAQRSNIRITTAKSVNIDYFSIKIYQKVVLKNFEIDWHQKLFLRMLQAMLQRTKVIKIMA